MEVKQEFVSGLKFERVFTKEGVHPYDEIQWDLRDAAISSDSGEKVFEQKNVEVPKFWSQTATNIVVSKYFRGKVGTPEREISVKQIVDRVAKTISKWGVTGKYFASDEDARIFEQELTHLLVNQMAVFNSPVWFNVGVPNVPQQCSACQPYRSLINTPQGLIPIGEVVNKNLLGLEVFDSKGITKVIAVKNNGIKKTYRVNLANGTFIEATGDHLVKAVTKPRGKTFWTTVAELQLGMKMHLHTNKISIGKDYVNPSEAALAGWLQTDGFVGRYEKGTNNSLTLEFETVTDEEFEWVMNHIKNVFGDSHYKIREVKTQDKALKYRRIRFYGKKFQGFVEKYDLLKRRTEMRAPKILFTANTDAVIAYLRSVFQAEGYVATTGNSCRLGMGMISKDLVKDVQLLLYRLGIYSRIYRKIEKRNNRRDLWELSINIGSERKSFFKEIGFISSNKVNRLSASLQLENQRVCSGLREETVISIEEIGDEEVFDIQTESGEYLTNNVCVHNCFILRVEDDMNSILKWYTNEGLIFKGGSGSGVNLSRLRSSKEHLSGGGLASGPISFMKAADAVAGSIKSGGRTRRAAKMVILNMGHPDIVQFIKCKADEEKKAWALIDAGYDGAFNVAGGAYDTISFQNANNSVRITDEFMRAVLSDDVWHTRYVKSGEIAETYKARDLMSMIAEAAWVCADPGVQFDTTMQRWHTCPNSDRINATNPCSEFCFIDNTSCNLASINLMKFRKEDSQFDVEKFKKAVDTMITAMEIIVGFADYPTPEITDGSHDFRPLGLGYANLGALLMSKGLPYDSDEARNFSGAVTALLTGQAYRQSATLAKTVGPFSEYKKNEEPMLNVIRMHRDYSYRISSAGVPLDLLEAAKKSWDEAYALGSENGFRNAQATVLAPTGTISFLMDCDTTGVEPDIALVKYKWLVGGGTMKLVNNTVPEALKKMGYTQTQSNDILDYISKNDTIEGSALRAEHLPVFDCAFKAAKGKRSIHYNAHLKMLAAVQPFVSGSISKTVNMPNEATAQEIADTYINAWKMGLKCVALYRDGCKRTQPLTTSSTMMQNKIQRRRMPDERQAVTHKFVVGSTEGYLTVGLFEDGSPGELFVTMSKEGSTLSGVMDCFATSISIGLQYGVPLKVLASKFIHTRFEPSGITNNKDVKFAKSIMDYIFRWMSLRFLSKEEMEELGIAPVEQAPLTSFADVKPEAKKDVKGTFVNQEDAPPCPDCGAIMVRNGACYKCTNCGSTSGCS